MDKRINPFVADAKIVNAILIPVSIFLWLRVPALFNEALEPHFVVFLSAVPILVGIALLSIVWWRTPNCKAVHACSCCHQKAKRQLRWSLLILVLTYPAMLLSALVWYAFFSLIFTGSVF